ncbi:MAG TPA: aminotransferase class I/II-fold pyridoxal phosphate-dependent enzyme [Streptosporangiaceae bacterium]|jgi:aspartate/methionine/tyrosine aminotransferase
MRLSPVATDVPRSGIRSFGDRAEGIAGPEPVIRLELGDPDFTTPAHISDAAARAVREGHTGYAKSSGVAELKGALADKLRARNGVAVAPEQVVITNGGTQALYLALLATLTPGDEVLVPDPGFPGYRTMAAAAGGVPVPYRLDPGDGFVPDAGAVAALVTDRTRVLLINSPGNPTGAVFPAAALQALLDLAEERDLWVVSDEVYDEMTFGRGHVSALALDHRDRVMSVFSFSKTYAMTGWRLGYLAAPAAAAATLPNLVLATVSCVATPTQLAGVTAVSGPQDAVAEMRAAYRARRDMAVPVLRAAGVPVHVPEGAFYLWIDVSGSGMSDMEFAGRLLEEHRVAVAPGTAFGDAGAGFVRVSLATAAGPLRTGVTRLAGLYAASAAARRAGPPPYAG